MEDGHTKQGLYYYNYFVITITNNRWKGESKEENEKKLEIKTKEKADSYS